MPVNHEALLAELESAQRRRLLIIQMISESHQRIDRLHEDLREVAKHEAECRKALEH